MAGTTPQTKGAGVAAVSSATAETPAKSIDELKRGVREAHARVEAAMLVYLQGDGDEAELEAAARAEGEARFQLLIAGQRVQMEGVIKQMMSYARQKYRETESLRDPRPFVRGRG